MKQVIKITDIESGKELIPNSEFEVIEDKYGTCIGCWAKTIDSDKCIMLRNLLGSCFSSKREDRKNVIYKLIK